MSKTSSDFTPTEARMWIERSRRAPPNSLVIAAPQPPLVKTSRRRRIRALRLARPA